MPETASSQKKKRSSTVATLAKVDLSKAGDELRGGVLAVNESFARLVFGGRNPIGHRIRVLEGPAAELPSCAATEPPSSPWIPSSTIRRAWIPPPSTWSRAG